jgi:hypothetical protein
MSRFDGFLWDVEDYAGRAVTTAKVAGKVAFLVTKAYPFIVGGLLLVLSGIGFWLDSGTPVQTVPQQIMAHNRPGGTTFWMLQDTGSNSDGLFSMGGDKKQEADFTNAVRFCTAHKEFDGCQRVIKAANASSGMYGY